MCLGLGRVCAREDRCSQRPEEGVGSPGAGGISSRGLLYMGIWEPNTGPL